MKRSRCHHVIASLSAASTILNGSAPSSSLLSSPAPSQTSSASTSSLVEWNTTVPSQSMSLSSMTTIVPSSTFSSALPSFTAQPTQSYTLARSMVGADFYDGFEFVTFDDPTYGRVNYVDRPTAEAGNLTYLTSDNTFVIRGDDTKVVKPEERGRDSIRLHSRDFYEDGLFVLDVRHMPAGCGTWPAWWTNAEGEAWPAGGEVDIIEGTHGRGAGLQSLHTTKGCMQPANRTMSGRANLPDCNAGNGGTGCGVSINKPGAFGAGHNEAGGGWHIMRRSATEGISMWFFSRNDPSTPSSVIEGADHISEADLGIPASTFIPTQCEWQKFFKPHKFILNLTFCGGWGIQTYPSNCPATCDAHVDSSPEAFSDAYWDVSSFRIYA